MAGRCLEFEKMRGSACGIRIDPKYKLNNINSLRAETVGFQHLSLRHCFPLNL
jgi:hypothetical protein